MLPLLRATARCLSRAVVTLGELHIEDMHSKPDTIAGSALNVLLQHMSTADSKFAHEVASCVKDVIGACPRSASFTLKTALLRLTHSDDVNEVSTNACP
jgi:hypothetical protein